MKPRGKVCLLEVFSRRASRPIEASYNGSNIPPPAMTCSQSCRQKYRQQSAGLTSVSHALQAVALPETYRLLTVTTAEHISSIKSFKTQSNLANQTRSSSLQQIAEKQASKDPYKTSQTAKQTSPTGKPKATTVFWLPTGEQKHKGQETSRGIDSNTSVAPGLGQGHPRGS